MIGAFAVSSDSRTSGSGFADVGREVGREVGEGREAEREFWLSEVTASAAHWSGVRTGNGRLSDAQFNTIMAELSKIKQMVRQLLHG